MARSGKMAYEKPELKGKRTLLITGLIMVAAEVIKQLLLTFVTGGGNYQWWYFPWQLCSIPMYVCIIVGLCDNKNVFEACISFLSCFGLLAGICAFLDTSGFKYELGILTVYSYIWHFALIGIGIYAWNIRLKGSFNGYAFLTGAGIYLAGCTVAEIINVLAFDNGFRPINMFYISPRYLMAQVYIKDMVPVIGNEACILLYIAVTIVGALIIEIIGNSVVHIIKKRGNENVSSRN